MNEFQQNLYTSLIELVEHNEAFFYADVERDDEYYRIFNYRLASYSDFCQPEALNCRGTMFRMSGSGKDAVALALVSLPFEKFFNLYENPFTMDLDLTKIVAVEEKADGSLISTYRSEKGNLHFKSKGSVVSEQAINSMNWLLTSESSNPSELNQEAFYWQLNDLDANGFTVNMEWVAPDNRVVLGYVEPELKVLGVRSRLDGSYLSYERLVDEYPAVAARFVERFQPDDPTLFVNNVANESNVEGYVLHFEDGQRVKVKTDWYVSIHRLKDSINSPRRLFEAVLDDTVDDLKAMLHDDALAIIQIEAMQSFVEERYNHMVDVVERFYERNKNLERKEYAILGQQELDQMCFGLAMQKYTGREPNYKDFLKKKWKELGLRDGALQEEE